MEAICWKWQSLDGAMVKAPLAQETVGPNPTNREKRQPAKFVSRRRGVPLSLVVSGANRHNVTQLEIVLDQIVVERPDEIEPHRCAKKGYYGDTNLQMIVSKGNTPQVKSREKEIDEKKGSLVTNLGAGWSKGVIPGPPWKTQHNLSVIATPGSCYNYISPSRCYLRISS